MQAKTQLIAHDKEVYDIAFAAGVNVFASVGADGSVRARCLAQRAVRCARGGRADGSTLWPPGSGCRAGPVARSPVRSPDCWSVVAAQGRACGACAAAR